MQFFKKSSKSIMYIFNFTDGQGNQTKTFHFFRRIGRSSQLESKTKNPLKHFIKIKDCAVRYFQKERPGEISGYQPGAH
jgi:hypothetical protein